MKWLLLDGDGNVVGSAVASGRVKALHAARRVHGGQIHVSGTRVNALIGSALGRAVTAHEAVERDGELMLLAVAGDGDTEEADVDRFVDDRESSSGSPESIVGQTFVDVGLLGVPVPPSGETDVTETRKDGGNV